MPWKLGVLVDPPTSAPGACRGLHGTINPPRLILGAESNENAMNPLLQSIISHDQPTLSQCYGSSVPIAALDRIKSLHRAGSLDSLLEEPEHDALVEMYGPGSDLARSSTVQFWDGRTDSVRYRVFSDGSLHVVTNADSDVWSNAAHFVRDHLMAASPEDLSPVDLALIDHIGMSVAI